jgi:PAS domain-containing protein
MSVFVCHWGELQKFQGTIEQLKRFLARLGEFGLPGAVVDYDNRCFIAWNEAFLDRTGYSADEIRVLEPRTIILLGSDTEGSAPKETDDAKHKRFAVSDKSAQQNVSHSWLLGHGKKDHPSFSRSRDEGQS